MPGAVFHLTARIHGRDPLLRGLEARVIALIHRCSRRSDARVLAYAIMPNHLHLVVVQGMRPLSHLMQPLLCRAALLIQRRHRLEGHVFERRFRDAGCHDVDYFRSAVAYVHLNPVRAGLCRTADEYEWTSHGAYCNGASAAERFSMNVQQALRMFAPHARHALTDCREGYFEFMRWRVAMDEFLASGGEPGAPGTPPRPSLTGGDRHWFAEMSLVPSPIRAIDNRPSLDLGAVARQVLLECAPEMCLDWLRSGERGRQLVAVRRLTIARALDAGHTPRQVSRYLCVSLAAVSDVVTSVRRPPPT
jgi:REP element-mobilizing transposase RayT